jgi:hypothetical protein
VGTSDVIPGHGEGSHAISAQAVPGLFSLQEGLAAEGAASGNQVFPDEGREPCYAVHTFYKQGHPSDAFIWNGEKPRKKEDNSLTLAWIFYILLKT